jgi:sterol desaturase/sphingolipid hydroxylase (fatty acid hydroxylase superfamily)
MRSLISRKEQLLVVVAVRHSADLCGHRTPSTFGAMNEILSRLPLLLVVAAYALFWGWEAIAARRVVQAQPGRRRGNLLISVLSFVLGGITGTALLALAAWTSERHWGNLATLSMPPWIQWLVGVLLLDVTDYWRHRISHVLGWLWRLHRVHHTDLAMDVTTSFRNHPLEMLLRAACLAATTLAFGIPPMALLLQPLLMLPVLVFQHANIRLHPAIDSALAWLIVTPGIHVVHHSRATAEADSNFATLFTVWDRLFRTFKPASAPAELGVDGFEGPDARTLGAMLTTPWR